MTTFPEFADWIFPGDDLSRQRNPEFHMLDPEVQNLITEVECRSGIDRRWLARVAGLVVDGLAGLQCLWFLHGAEGSISEDMKHPPADVKWAMRPILNDATDAATDRAMQKAGHPVEVKYGNYDWGAGTIEETRVNYESEDGKGDIWNIASTKVRNLKLGKWLKKWGAPPELRKAFETREMPNWNWRISADPLDVLTMSFRRPWTSCMRPPDPEGKAAGEAQYGPLTDMAAGAVVLFFYRPGADVPCGRMMLRPASSGTGMVVLWPGQRVYGCGPAFVSADELEAMLGPYLEPHRIELHDTGLCWVGDRGFALSRLVYSDVDNSFCQQSDAKYDEAYALLDSLPWPESEYAGDKLRPEALKWQGEVGTDIATEGVSDADVQGAISAITDTFMEVYDLQQLWKLSFSELTEMIDDQLETQDMSILEDEDLRDDVYNGVGENIDRYVMAAVHESPTDVLVIRDGRDLTRLDYRDRDPLGMAIQRLQNEHGAQAIWSMDTNVHATNMRAKLDMSVGEDDLWFIGVSQALWNEQEAYPEELVADFEELQLEPGEWRWQSLFSLDRF